MIYTSYFAKSGNLPNAVSIALTSPKFFKGREYPDLMPTWELIGRYNAAGEINQITYKKIYLDLLKGRKLDPVTVGKDLDNCVLLCWETPDKFCHRQVVAEWLNDLGFEVKEIG